MPPKLSYLVEDTLSIVIKQNLIGILFFDASLNSFSIIEEAIRNYTKEHYPNLSLETLAINYPQNLFNYLNSKKNQNPQTIFLIPDYLKSPVIKKLDQENGNRFFRLNVKQLI